MSSTSISISDLLRETEQLFSKAHIPTPRLDAEVLLAYALNVSRPYLHAHPNEFPKGLSFRKFEEMVEKRLRREPLAYITGKKEFYGREFTVTPDVLIPRPETEAVVDMALEMSRAYKDFPCYKENPCSILDVGCGSGCIGLTLKLERPGWDVTLCDISAAALATTNDNAEKLKADVRLVKSDLLTDFLTDKLSHFTAIVANLPYVDRSWETSPETTHEPDLALYADQNGLSLIFRLIESSRTVLEDNGLLLLEADPEQHAQITRHAAEYGFKLLEVRGYAIGFTKLQQA